jgi:hypothetical protein
MGWLEYPATYHYDNGSVNRKKECDSHFEDGLNAGHFKILKSTMKGSVYYAAIMPLKKPVYNEQGEHAKDADSNYMYVPIPAKDREVIGVVVLTGTRKNGYWFAYKSMDETVGPCYYDCPATILDLLTPTTNPSALDWRRKCQERAGKQKHGALPVGATIEFVKNGNTYTLTKRAPAHQFKNTWWSCEDEEGIMRYYSKKRIPVDFSVVNMPLKK